MVAERSFNIDECWECKTAYGGVSAMNVNFFSILMNEPTIHGKERGVYIQLFRREEFMKRGNPTATELLKLPDVQDVSAHADVLKAILRELLIRLKNTACMAMSEHQRI